MSHVDEGQLHAWLDGEVTGVEAGTIESHLQACSACRDLLEEAARVHALASELVEDLVAEAEPKWYELAARAELEKHPSNAGAGRRRRLVPALAWAATLAVAFLLGWQVRLVQGPTQEQRQVVAAIEPGQDPLEPELQVRLERESLQPAPISEPRAATPEPRAATPEPRAATPEPRAATPEPRAATLEPRAATPEKPVRDEVSSQVASPELGRASARLRELEAVAAEFAEPEEQLQTPPAAAPLRKMAAVQFLSADAIERDQLPSPEQEEIALRGERRPLQLTGAVLESTETVDSSMRLAEKAGPGVLRVVYQDPQTGARVTLLQRFVDLTDRAGIGADLGTSPATATFTVPADGLPSLQWLTPAGVLLTLEADLDEAGLRRLALRVR